ncbi:hypothetical protein [Streptomyces sp. NPDC048266]|uniref:hypothetical protein n=1 Tax=Streptomyces sp. NPDC048266 TaxID=3155787 RepID=UPI0033D7681C
MEIKPMTSSLDVAGLVPAVAAAVQAAAVVVHMYWERRQLAAGTTEDHAAHSAWANRHGDGEVVLVQVRVEPPFSGDVAVAVRIGGGSGGMDAPAPEKEHGPW